MLHQPPGTWFRNALRITNRRWWAVVGIGVGYQPRTDASDGAVVEVIELA